MASIEDRSFKYSFNTPIYERLALIFKKFTMKMTPTVLLKNLETKEETIEFDEIDKYCSKVINLTFSTESKDFLFRFFMNNYQWSLNYRSRFKFNEQDLERYKNYFQGNVKVDDLFENSGKLIINNFSNIGNNETRVNDILTKIKIFERSIKTIIPVISAIKYLHRRRPFIFNINEFKKFNKLILLFEKEEILSLPKKENVDIFYDTLELLRSSKVFKFDSSPISIISGITKNSKENCTQIKLLGDILFSKFEFDGNKLEPAFLLSCKLLELLNKFDSFIDKSERKIYENI